jgi:hypothetical protein
VSRSRDFRAFFKSLKNPLPEKDQTYNAKKWQEKGHTGNCLIYSVADRISIQPGQLAKSGLYGNKKPTSTFMGEQEILKGVGGPLIKLVKPTILMRMPLYGDL